MINTFNRLCIAGLALVFVGCATHPPSAPPPVTAPPIATPQPETPVIVQPQPGATPKPAPVALNPAALSLAKQARGQYSGRDYQGAIATAERGLRIERRAADLYLILAQSYVQLGLPQKAGMFVQQGLRFAVQGSDVANGLLRVRESISQ